MDTNYDILNQRLVTAITAHLLNLGALSPSTDVAALAQELTALMFRELRLAGVTKLTIDDLPKLNEPIGGNPRMMA